MLAHGAAGDAGRLGPPECWAGLAGLADAAQPASTRAAQHASEASRGTLSGLQVMESRVLEVMYLRRSARHDGCGALAGEIGPATIDGCGLAGAAVVTASRPFPAVQGIGWVIPTRSRNRADS